MVSSSLNKISTIEARIAGTPEEKKELDGWIRATYKPEFDKLGMPSASDSVAHKSLRGLLFIALGEAGDPSVIGIAQHLTELYLADPNSIDPSLVRPATQIAAQNGDDALFTQVQKVAETASNPTQQENALGMMMTFEQPQLADRAYDFMVSGKVRNQDSIPLLAYALGHPGTRDLAWHYVQANWPRVQAQLTEMMGGYLVSATGSFCSAAKGQEVQTFFTEHPVHAAERALARAKDQINDCVALRAAQEGNLQGWLATHKQ